MRWFHVSKRCALHIVGMRINSRPAVGRRPSPYIYLGSLDYIRTQYLRYAPRGMYFLYEVDVDGLTICADLPGEQIRIPSNISHKRIKYVGELHST